MIETHLAPNKNYRKYGRVVQKHKQTLNMNTKHTKHFLKSVKY